jgi:hypothetical protein
MATGGGYPRHGRTTPRKADPTLPFAARPAEHPPQELNEEEAEIWTAIINRAPEHFAPPDAMLINLCRHIRMSRWFARQQRDLEEQLPHARDEQHAKLLRAMMAISRAQALESRIIALLCARLRLTPATPHTARPTEHRPWDIPGGDGDELQ